MVIFIPWLLGSYWWLLVVIFCKKNEREGGEKE